MLLTVAMGLLLQAPQDMQAFTHLPVVDLPARLDVKPWVERGFDPTRPDAYAVSGTPELTRKEAAAAVEQHLAEDHVGRLTALADQQARAIASAWLPGFARERVVRAWTRDQLRRLQPRILDRDVVVREHSFGRSYQAFLLVEEVDAKVVQKRGSLARRLQNAEEEFVIACGVTVGFWGLLALILAWIDRLSRGYMTGRLVALGAALGIAGPALLVLL